MPFTLSHLLPIECHPRSLTDKEKHDFISWLQLEYSYELEGTNSDETYAEIEQSLNNSYVAVFGNGRNDFFSHLIAVINLSAIELYTLSENGEFAHKGTYEQL